MKKIILLFIIGVFLINLVYAGDWFDYDNYKSFDKDIGKYGKISIIDKALIGKDKVLQTIELKTNTEICPGDFCSAIKEVIMYEDGKLIEDVRFFNLETKRLTNIKGYEVYVDGKLYDGKEVDGNSEGITYQVELRGKLNPFQRVDWQIKFRGFWINEWADWHSGLSRGLNAYYDFEESSGTVLPNKINASFNGTLTNMENADWVSDGIIGNGLFFDGGSDEYVEISSHGLLNYNAFSISVWLKPNETDRPTDTGVFDTENSSTTKLLYIYRPSGQNKVDVYQVKSTTPFIFHNNSKDAWNKDGTWLHLVVVLEDNNCSMYYNGILNQSSGGCDYFQSDPTKAVIGSRILSVHSFNGTIDEMGIWNRTLSASEVIDLYNGGAGISYSPPTISISLNFPSNNTITTDLSFNLTASYSTGFFVLQNATYNIWFDNSTLFNQSTFVIDTSINVTNISFTGFILENYLWNIYACGDNATVTHCNSAKNNYSFTVGTKVIGESFNNETIEGNIESFKINVTIPSSLQLSKANFVYNETIYLTSSIISIGGDNYTMTKNLQIPDVDNDENMTFYWNFLYANSFEDNSTKRNQTVRALAIDDCSAQTTLILNLILRDETNQTILGGDLFNTTIELNVNIFPVGSSTSILNFSNLTSKINPTSVCIKGNLSGVIYRMDSIIKYESSLREIEYYNLQNFSLTSSTIPQHIDLYDLLSADSTEFQLTFTGSDFLPVENALIYVKRQYISENVFKTVELPKTDSNGQTILHLVRNDVVYNLEVMKEGVVLGNFENIIAFCDDVVIGDCKIILSAAESGDAIFSYDEALGITYTGPTYDNITRIITFNFLTFDGSVKTVLMNATRNDIFGNISICSASVVSSGGILTCEVPSYIEDSTIITKVFVDGKEILKDYTVLSKFNYGKAGYFIFFIYMLAFILMFSKSKTTMLIGIVVGFIVGISLGLISGKLIGIGASGIWLVIVIILMVWKLNKERPN